MSLSVIILMNEKQLMAHPMGSIASEQQENLFDAARWSQWENSGT
jgi:hypothetical protein